MKKIDEYTFDASFHSNESVNTRYSNKEFHARFRVFLVVFEVPGGNKSYKVKYGLYFPNTT